ncbi:MAG: ribokinase [Chloroflexi bacterium]|nr:ribokinase [Chloroflexota bacterium]
MPPNFVVVGHLTRDLVPGGVRLGGAAAYAAMMAHRLGRRVGVATSYGPDLPLAELPEGIEVAVTPSERTTTFRNDPAPEGRRQYVEAVASHLDLEQVPWAWLDSQIVLAAPVLDEVDPTLLGRFQDSLVAAAAQGWLRRWEGPQTPLRRRGLEVLAALPPLGALFLSQEDFSGDLESSLADLGRTPIALVTHGSRGAQLWWQGRWQQVPAYPAREVDPTGAGDVFAAAFLVRLSEVRDPLVAAQFASAAASLKVEGQGLAAVPTRAAVEARLAEPRLS